MNKSMRFIKAASISAGTLLIASVVSAQSDIWSGLARSQFDSDASTLRIPCAVLKDQNGNALPDLAPAYALNFLLSNTEPGNERFQLVEPIAEFTEIPDSCLDTLTVSSDLSSATYTSNSIEIDSDAAAFRDRFYALELQANLLMEGPVEFSVVTVSSRDYRRPNYNGETYLAFVGPPPYTTQFVFDDDLLQQAKNVWNAGLVVYEAGRVQNDCYFDDPSNLLEVIEVVGTNVRKRLKPAVTAADNGKEFYAVCTAFNLDINRLEKSVQVYAWTVYIY